MENLGYVEGWVHKSGEVCLRSGWYRIVGPNATPRPVIRRVEALHRFPPTYCPGQRFEWIGNGTMFPSAAA